MLTVHFSECGTLVTDILFSFLYLFFYFLSRVILHFVGGGLCACFVCVMDMHIGYAKK